MGIIEDTKDQVKAWQGLIGLIVGTALACTAMLTYCSPPPPAPTAEPVLAQANPKIAKETKVDTPLVSPKKTVRTYAASAKGLIALPKDALDDPAKHVTDSVVLPSTEKRQVVTQVIDAGTGETTSYVSTAPSPWLALENRGQLSLDYGIKRGSREPVARLNVHQDVLQIKRLHLGASASMYSDGDYFVGIGGSVRW